VNCETAKNLISPYTDGELAPAEVQAFENHLNGCASCRAEHKYQVGLGQLLSRNGRFEPPVGLPARIRGRLRQLDGTSAPGLRLPPWLTIATPSLALGFALAWGLALTINPAGDKLSMEPFIAAHVRSLMADHLTDVASSDRHTVKPWFNGKLDFSPPVEDLTRDGFPLVGGRLDYLEDRPVAALVHRHRRHVINLFIHASQRSADEALKTVSQRGYHLLSWRRDGLTYQAISDLNLADMQKFVAMLDGVDRPGLPVSPSQAPRIKPR